MRRLLNWERVFLVHHVMRYPEHEHASGALDYIHAPHALTHVR